jgi:hypothetical protein
VSAPLGTADVVCLHAMSMAVAGRWCQPNRDLIAAAVADAFKVFSVNSFDALTNDATALNLKGLCADQSRML